MCGTQSEYEQRGYERHGHRHGGRGPRGFGRGGFPRREAWVERLQAYQAHLEEELANVKDVIQRLGPIEPDQPTQI
jgi:hypothetical protein